MSERKPYTITDRAGRRVAGHVVEKVGQELHLTDAEAEFELREGTITPKGKELPASFTKGSAKMNRLRKEAADFKARIGEDAAPATAAEPAPEEPAGAGSGDA